MTVPTPAPSASCAKTRDRLLAAPDATALPTEVADHLADCRDCASFAARRAALREALRREQSVHQPGADFAVRVVANLPTTTEVLGWAALRLLPAALALLVGLTFFGMQQTPPPTALLADPSADLLLAYTALAPDGAP